MSSSQDIVDTSTRVSPGSSPAYFVNKRFPRSIFQDNQLSTSRWSLPANNKKGAVTRSRTTDTNTNLAVAVPEESKDFQSKLQYFRNIVS